MSDKTYEGWSSYNTWAVKLWLDNDYETHKCWRQSAMSTWAEAQPDKPITRRENACMMLAEHLKDDHIDNAPLFDGQSTVYSDLLCSALSDVNWHEIADSMIGDYLESLQLETPNA